MKRALLSAVAVCSLAACNAETPEAPEAEASTAPISEATPAPAPLPAQSPEPEDAPTTPDEKTAAAGEMLETIPVRFHGTYAQSQWDCEARSHSRFTVSADKIQFFESSAEVLSVRADGDYAAVDAEESYADNTSRYVFYMALEGEDRLRYRYDKNKRLTWERCKA